MKKLDFLKKIKLEGKLQLVSPSGEISQSYLKKSENCLKSARILFENNLYENSTSEAYYCSYNSLLALLFAVGIKSENHSASIYILEELFDKELAKIITQAKNERIDKQYYIETQQNTQISEQSCQEMFREAEKFLVKIKLIISNLKNERISKIRESFKILIK
jgi:uncharacterized protein (UPF0332 family)